MNWKIEAYAKDGITLTSTGPGWRAVRGEHTGFGHCIDNAVADLESAERYASHIETVKKMQVLKP